MDAIKRFLVATAARDCSLMISMQFVDPAHASALEVLDAPGCGVLYVGGFAVYFAVRLIDMDPRSPSKIAHYNKQERKIVSSFQAVWGGAGVGSAHDADSKGEVSASLNAR